jgi:P4 family phage/plasmid primase-like protien
MSMIQKLTIKNEFRTFLKSCKITPGEKFTHTLIGDSKNNIPGGSYYISKEKYEEFIKLYVDEVLVRKNICHITEKHDEKGPIVIDLDFRFHVDNGINRVYTIEHIQKFVSKYIDLIKEYIEIETDQELWCYLFEKSSPVNSNGVIKDGIHLMFPYIITKPNIQYMFREEILKVFNEIFDNLNCINSSDNIFDSAVIENNNWLMYGSCKPNSEPYSLTGIYTKLDNQIIKIEKDIPKRTLVRTLSIRYKEIKSSIKESKKEIINKMCGKFNKPKKIIKLTTSKHNLNHLPDSELKLVKKLLDILSKKRSDDHNQWMEVGWCLRNLDINLLGKWIEFSKKSDKFEDGVCNDKWQTMNVIIGGLGLGSLHKWAKEDNELAYKDIIRTSLINLIRDSTNGTTTDISKVVYEMYKHRFKCGSIKMKTWYEFDGRWKELDGGVSLRKCISGEVVNEYLTLESDYTLKAVKCEENDPHKLHYTHNSKKLLDVSIKIRDTNFKDKLMKECGEIFWEDKFTEKLDCNINLIGFENGVYDLEKLEFREGRPEDLISLTAGIDYIDVSEAPYVEEVMDFMNQILPIKRVRDYVLKLLSSFLNGKIGEEKFHIWTGTGGNGKSKLIELFEHSFGDYCCKLPITLLTQKRAASNSATPELARTKGKRFACLQEPDENEHINVGIMKEMSGGDKIQGRALYKEPIEFKPQFKMILTCNRLPKVPADDGGTWRRLRVVDFSSEFVENPDPEKPNQFPIDYELSSKLEMWRESFMAILISYYKDYMINGCQDPPEVIERTKQYRQYNDMYSEFINDHIEEDPKGSIKLEDLHSCFKVWHKDAYGDQKCPVRKDLRNFFEKKFGMSKAKKNMFIGISLMLDDEDDEDDIKI